MRVVEIGTAVPELSIEQGRAAIQSAPLVASDDRRRRLLETLFARSGVERRHSVVLERADGEGPRQTFYPDPRDDRDGGPGTADRMRAYERHCLGLAVTASEKALGAARDAPATVTHLVTVSCTGFFAPGLDVALIPALGLRSDAQRTHVGFMGCHGLFNGLAVARALIGADPEARVLVCATELCSLHFHYGWDSERLVANALFADGAAAMLCAGGPGPARLRVEATGSELIPDSTDAMSWRIRDHGFEMTLSSRVPGLIREAVPAALERWLSRHDLTPADISTWAVHPGGPRILTAFEEAMSLPADSLAASRSVLARYGNMSSATIAFILRELADSRTSGTGVALGFGPGLMAEMLLVRF